VDDDAPPLPLAAAVGPLPPADAVDPPMPEAVLVAPPAEPEPNEPVDACDDETTKVELEPPKPPAPLSGVEKPQPEATSGSAGSGPANPPQVRLPGSSDVKGSRDPSLIRWVERTMHPLAPGHLLELVHTGAWKQTFGPSYSSGLAMQISSSAHCQSWWHENDPHPDDAKAWLPESMQ
jgi:hypothetical protein